MLANTFLKTLRFILVNAVLSVLRCSGANLQSREKQKVSLGLDCRVMMPGSHIAKRLHRYRRNVNIYRFKNINHLEVSTRHHLLAAAPKSKDYMRQMFQRDVSRTSYIAKKAALQSHSLCSYNTN